MNLKLIVASTLLALSTAAFAQPAPDKCPGVEAMRSSHLENFLEQGPHGDWDITTANKFDTNSVWRLWMVLRANSVDEAKWKLNVYLNQIAVLRDGPIEYKDPRGQGWICTYETYKKAFLITVTPDWPVLKNTFFSRDFNLKRA